MPRNKIEDLRNHLFETLEGLKDKSIDIDRARAISDVAKQIIESAKVEVDFISQVGGCGSGFMAFADREQNTKLLKGETNDKAITANT